MGEIASDMGKEMKKSGRVAHKAYSRGFSLHPTVQLCCAVEPMERKAFAQLRLAPAPATLPTSPSRAAGITDKATSAVSIC